MNPKFLETRRSVRELFMPAFELCEEAPEVIGQICGTFERAGERHGIARFLVAPSYWEQRRPEERIAFVGGLDGRDEVGPRLLLSLLERLALDLEPPYNLLPIVYPVANPAGYEAGTALPPGGADLTRENWSRSRQPEIAILEKEVRSCHFQGLVLIQETDAETPSVALHDSTLQFRRVLCALSAAAGVVPERVEFGGTLADDGATAVFSDLPESPWLVSLRIPRAALHQAHLAEDALEFLTAFLGFYARRQGHLPPGAGSLLNRAAKPTPEALLSHA
jgi:hypothetical protein